MKSKPIDNPKFHHAFDLVGAHCSHFKHLECTHERTLCGSTPGFMFLVLARVLISSPHSLVMT